MTPTKYRIKRKNSILMSFDDALIRNCWFDWTFFYILILILSICNQIIKKKIARTVRKYMHDILK